MTLADRLGCAADYFSRPGTYSRSWQQHVATIREAVEALTRAPKPGIHISREDRDALVGLYNAACEWLKGQLSNTGRHMLCGYNDRLATATEEAKALTLGGKLVAEPGPEPGIRLSREDYAVLVTWAELREKLTTLAYPEEATRNALAVCRKLRDQPEPRPPTTPTTRNDLIRLAMERAVKLYGDKGDGVFNGASFSATFCKLAGLASSAALDGHVVRAMLTGRDDVLVLKGGSHYRLFEQLPEPE